MSDPRYSSVQLEAERRADFRWVREVLFESRGPRTSCAEQSSDDDESSRTAVHPHGVRAKIPEGLDFWLTDQMFIYPLKIGLNTIGRAAENDVVVDDTAISRRHFAILIHAVHGCELHDISSKNGTFLNEMRLNGPTPLNPGDHIRICDRSFIFQSRRHNAGIHR